MKNIAIILAAGEGTRTGAALPKQFREIGGKTVLEHTISRFDKHHEIDELVVVVSSKWLDRAQELIHVNRLQKPCSFIEGGKSRSESSLLAINAINDLEANVLIHDAARPFVSEETITAVLKELESYEAVCVAAPVSDTLFMGSAELMTISAAVPRDGLWQAQTPQGFKLSVIKAAYEHALQDPFFEETDDCSVVLRYLPEISIRIALGKRQNIKLTFEEDFEIVEKLLEA